MHTGVAGNSLYGGYIDGYKSFYGLDTDYNTSNPSEVSSNLVGVCFCSLTSSNTLGLEPNYQNKTSQVTVYPVELFHILIGQMNGTAPGVTLLTTVTVTSHT